jgi:hypothetical protein
MSTVVLVIVMYSRHKIISLIMLTDFQENPNNFVINGVNYIGYAAINT